MYELLRVTAFPPAYQTWPKDAEELNALNAIADNDDYVTLMKTKARGRRTSRKVLDLNIRNFWFYLKANYIVKQIAKIKLI